ncbi:MAG TPA: mechanosensitive ion channel family protein, partial [Methanomassiliicoccales archaeon]|nr:mechanosensitive ion channel family protein [Methanomassiliicoccales archaeon]
TMPRRGFGGSLLLLAALFLICISPAAMSAPADVSIFQVSDDLTLDAGSSISYEWVVYNDGTDRLLIVPELMSSVPERMTWTLEPSYAVLEGGSGCSFYLNFSAGTDLYTDVVPLNVVFEVTDMNTLESGEVDHQIVLRAESLYGHLDRENRIMGVWENFLPSPLDGNWGAFGLSVLIWVAIGSGFMKVIGPAVNRLTRKTKSKWDDIAIEVVRLPLTMLIIAYGAITSLEILELPPSAVADLELTYMVIITIIASIVAYRILVKVVACYGKEICDDGKDDAKDVLVDAVSLVGKVAIPSLAIFVIAGLLGVNLGNVILGIGFLGLVIGYATQNTLSNMFAGMQLLFDRPFKPGDRVPLSDGHTGQVLDVGLITTTFLDLDTFEDVVVPNSLIESQVIVNMNSPDLSWKSNVKVRVPSDQDPLKVEELMMEASRRTPQILQGGRAPVVRLSQVKDGRMLLTIFIWIDDVANRHLARTEYRRNLVKVFEESGMEFAIPRSQVWLNH